MQRVDGDALMKVSKERLQIVTKPLAELKPYSKNSRTHTTEQIEQVCNSIKEFGWTSPILIDEKNIILAGHARSQAAKKLGITEVPCIVAKGLSEAQKRAYVIADNKLALNADWDAVLLRDEILSLEEMQYDLNLLGFSDYELSIMMDENWDSDISKVEKVVPSDDKAKAKITVECEQSVKGELVTLLRKAIDGAKITDVTIS